MTSRCRIPPPTSSVSTVAAPPAWSADAAQALFVIVDFSHFTTAHGTADPGTCTPTSARTRTFLIFLAVFLRLMQFYVWKRLVKDVTGHGPTRWALTALVVVLTALLVATLVLPSVIGATVSTWFAWPGYIWFAMVIYLFLTLLVLELPRLALRGWVKRKSLEAAADTVTEPVGEEPAPAKPPVNRWAFLARVSAVTAAGASARMIGVGMANAVGPPSLLRCRYGR
jgi:uncharacterized protein